MNRTHHTWYDIREKVSLKGPVLRESRSKAEVGQLFFNREMTVVREIRNPCEQDRVGCCTPGRLARALHGASQDRNVKRDFLSVSRPQARQRYFCFPLGCMTIPHELIALAIDTSQSQSNHRYSYISALFTPVVYPILLICVTTRCLAFVWTTGASPK
jgi:hypothetical protein